MDFSYHSIKQDTLKIKNIANENQFYTLESYKNKKLSKFKIPREVYKYNWEQVIYMHSVNRARVLNFTEIFFFILFTHQEWTVYTLPFNRNSYLDSYQLAALDELNYKINFEALYGKGCPDFLLVNRTRLKKPFRTPFKFVEIKGPKEQLSTSQINWIEKYSYDVEIARFS